MIKPLAVIFRWKYQYLLKPILFLFDAETVHNTFTRLGAFFGRVPFIKWVFRTIFVDTTIQPVTIDGISFPNRVGLGAGFDYNGDLSQILPDLGFGFHTIGTVTWDYYQGNPKPRLGRFPKSKALLVNKGLKSLGTPAIIKKLENTQLGDFKIPTGISIASANRAYDSVHEHLVNIVLSFLAFEQSEVKHSYYEMNISCPNTFGGEPFTTPERLDVLLDALDELKISKPLYLKMPIDFSDKEALQLLKVIVKHKVNGVIFGNLTKDKSNPAVEQTEAEQWKKVRGNLSGKPTWDRSNRLVALTKTHYGKKLTIIGMGGVFTPEDAVHKRELGADLLQMISGMIFEGPQTVGQIAMALDEKSKTK